MEWCPRQSFESAFRMVALERTPTAIFFFYTTYPTFAERRRTDHSSAYHVDGLDRTTHTVYEFHDPSQTSFSSSGRTMEALYQATIQKTQTLRDIRYTVYEMWECEWHAKVKAPPEIQGFSGVSRHSATSESLGRVFWGTYRCCFALLQSGRDPRGRNTLRRRDV